MDINSEEKDFVIEHAKSGRAACKKCKRFCEKGELRIAKLIPNHFGTDVGKLKHWYHIDCIFEVFKTQRATTKKIDSPEDLDGYDALTEEEQELILDKIQQSNEAISGTTTKLKKTVGSTQTSFLENEISKSTSKDNLFSTFENICEKIANTSGYIKKSNILREFLIKGTNGKKFDGNMLLWIKLLLPSIDKRVYNLKSKQLIKLFSKIFNKNHQEMLTDLEQGDVSETISKYFQKSPYMEKKCNILLTLNEIELFLDELCKLTKEDDQIKCFEDLCKKCNEQDIKMVVRLIKGDLRINAGPRHILDALSAEAYSTFQTSRNLESVVRQYGPLISQNKIKLFDDQTQGTIKGMHRPPGVQLMCPISPMLAEACKSVDKAIAKNVEGLYSEIKYDGERVQIHKKGNEFKFFSRNLKPVLNHKISRCKEFIPKAFPTGRDLILDSEIVVVDTQTGKLLRFGTLGVHKKEQFASSEVCLFIFDCIYYNGEDLTKKRLSERKAILKEIIHPIKYHVQLSEYYLIKTTKELALMTAKVLKSGLEGLVLKNINSLYQPGKRGWLKIKKDYLFEGKMADSADLVVMGSWFGAGKKGGIQSIFLMGCYDEKHGIWKTVTKVHTGLDDATLENIQESLNELMERCPLQKLPNWMSCKPQLKPDFIAKNPFDMPVWEITGAEFTKSDIHTAEGISIRFPRITRQRRDKSAKEATTLNELKKLFESSKECSNIENLFDGIDFKNEDFSIKTEYIDLNKSSDKSYSSEGNNDQNDIDSKGEIKKKLKRTSSSSNINVNTIDPPKKKKHSNKSSEPKIIIKKEIKEEISDSNVLDIFFSPEKLLQSKINQNYQKQSDIIEVKQLNDTFIHDGVFSGIKLFVYKADKESVISFIEEQFMNLGGQITQNSFEATHAIHKSNKCNDDFLCLRKLFQPSCRHLTSGWLVQCIAEEKLCSFVKYAVNLERTV